MKFRDSYYDFKHIYNKHEIIVMYYYLVDLLLSIGIGQKLLDTREPHRKTLWTKLAQVFDYK